MGERGSVNSYICGDHGGAAGGSGSYNTWGIRM